MIPSRLTPADERIIEWMIVLAGCSNLQGIIVAGLKGAELMLELPSHGYVRVATTGNRGLPVGQYDVALVDWRQVRSNPSRRRSVGLVNFSSCAAVLVVWVNSPEPAGNRNLASAMERHGVVVEAGHARTGPQFRPGDSKLNPISKVV